jgi:hypothetical protein
MWLKFTDVTKELNTFQFTLESEPKKGTFAVCKETVQSSRLNGLHIRKARRIGVFWGFTQSV